MSDGQQHHPQPEHDATGWVVLGAILVIAGFFLGASNLGLMPWPLEQVWDVVSKARFGIGILLIGVFLIVWAQSGKTMPRPRRGARLYRSREDKWLGGVLGGLAEYFGVDVTPVRLAFIALVVLFDIGALVVVYIVMAIVVPLEPVGGAAAAVAPPVATAWPTTGAPAAPAPPVTPAETPAAPAPSAPVAPPAAEPAPPVTPEGWDDGTPPPPAPPL